MRVTGKILGADACIRPRVDASIDPYRERDQYLQIKQKRDGHCPVSFSLKRRRKTERLAGACIEWKPPLYKWMPFLGNRQGALVFFLFYTIGKAFTAFAVFLLSMPKYYTIFVEIARCGFIQPAIIVTLHFVQYNQR